nr:MAG TPA: protein of unknown function DUF4376 [Caudoviricetes sp.]
MRIIDETGNEITNPDLDLGHLVSDTETIHHEATEEIKEEFHYETIAEYANGGKDVKKIIDVEAVPAKEAWDEEILIQKYILYTDEELKAILDEVKEDKIAQSKEDLKDFLANNPMQWLDGKYYSVTSEKQSLLTSNLALYQVSTAAGQPFKLTWNSTGEECSEWTYENLCALALAIGAYVKPFVSKQQEIELDIKDCSTKAEVEAIEIKYE